MTHRRCLLVILAALLALSVTPEAHAGTLTEQFRLDVERLFKTLGDPALKALSEERRRAIRDIGNELFDWPEMARQSLGRHWESRTEVERGEFVKLLPALVDPYLAALEGYRGDAIDYVGESTDGDRATVRTKIATQRGRAMSLDWRMIRRGDRWMIYDVVIDHASLIGTYRAQFYRIIKTASYETLVEKLTAR